jgi:formate dehydrogenase major subunit
MSERFDSTVTTACGYCGVGCRLEAHALNGRVASISPAVDGPANKGHTCLKGRFAHRFSRSRERLTAPLVREGGEFRLASWEEATYRIVSELSRIEAEHGPDAIAGLASSRATNEDCYAMSRLMRAAIGTNNIDNCSRVCHSPTSWALRKSFGLSGATGSFERAAHIYAEAGEACILWGLGVTEHRYGSEVVRLICNLAPMCGKVGRPGSALLPLRGQNNVQGSSDMGALPDTYTAYRPVSDEQVARSFEDAWGVPLSRQKGYTIPQMFDAAVDGRLKAMWIFGEDVAQTDPNTTHVIAALESLGFLVCQEIFANETTKYADVILPASSFLEKSGMFINAERRFQLVAPAIDPPGGAKTDFEIITNISKALGHDMGWDTPADTMDEIARLTPTYSGATHERIGRTGLQWPVAADGTDSPILYTDQFELPDGKAQFAAIPYKQPGDHADDEFPLILVTGRRLQRYNAGAMTRRTANLDLVSSDWLEIHPDAAKFWITDGQHVSVRSRVGRIEIHAKISERIEPGHVFTAFHFPEIRTNLLVGPSADVNTSCPEYKVIAVDVRPVAEQPAFTPAIGEPVVS